MSFFSIILRVAGVSLAWKPTARSSNICVIRDICVTKALQELLRVEEPVVSLRRRVELQFEVVVMPLREVRQRKTFPEMYGRVLQKSKKLWMVFLSICEPKGSVPLFLPHIPNPPVAS